MPWNLLLLPLLAGYCALHICHFFRFRAQKQDGNRLLFESALAGIPLLILGRLTTYWLASKPVGKLTQSAMTGIVDVPFIGTGIASLLFGIALPLIANAFTSTERAKWWAIKATDNGFLRLAQTALRREMPISLTLKTRKVYIGYVVQTPNLKLAEQYIHLLPLVSGYREPTTLALKLTADYAKVYATGEVDVDDFAITIPLASIDSANLFDSNAYELFLEGATTPPEDQDELFSEVR
jgi:hypothetical protein